MDKKNEEVEMIGDGVEFERTRRITGYLVGTLDKFNNAKRQEEKDRVKHDMEKDELFEEIKDCLVNFKNGNRNYNYEIEESINNFSRILKKLKYRDDRKAAMQMMYVVHNDYDLLKSWSLQDLEEYVFATTNDFRSEYRKCFKIIKEGQLEIDINAPKYDEWSHNNSYESAINWAKKWAKKEKSDMYVVPEKKSLGNGFTAQPIMDNGRIPNNSYVKVTPNGEVIQIKNPSINKEIKI